MVGKAKAWYQSLPQRKKAALRLFLIGLLLLVLSIIGFGGSLPYYQSIR